jgi:hypothetical protein
MALHAEEWPPSTASEAVIAAAIPEGQPLILFCLNRRLQKVEMDLGILEYILKTTS